MTIVKQLAPPFNIMEVASTPGVLRTWHPVYNFDTTDNGRLAMLPSFLFELREEKSKGKSTERPYRLYVDGQPCLGMQWQYSVESALHSINHFVGSYAYDRRNAIYVYQHESRKPLYVGYIDEVPDITTVPHEILEEATQEEVVVMWNTLKQKYMQLVEAVRQHLSDGNHTGPRSAKLRELVGL